MDPAIWFMEREIQLIKSWAEGVPSKEEFECQALGSEVAVDAFSVVMELENGEMVELLVLLHFPFLRQAMCTAGRLGSWTCCGWGTVGWWWPSWSPWGSSFPASGRWTEDTLAIRHVSQQWICDALLSSIWGRF